MKYLSPRDVMFRLNLKPGVVYSAIRRGDIPSIRLHPRGAIRIPLAAIEAIENAATNSGCTSSIDKPACQR